MPLPFPDAAFSVVVTRYSFHHFLDPKAVLAEMVRVCSPAGRVAVIDVFTSSAKQAEAYNRVEKLRDPSHVRALVAEELTSLCREAGLRDVKTAYYRLDMELDKLLASSFPRPGDAERIRAALRGRHRREPAGPRDYAAGMAPSASAFRSWSWSAERAEDVRSDGERRLTVPAVVHIHCITFDASLHR